jgi:CxxC motif-containing protein (DUF1111 family)
MVADWLGFTIFMRELDAPAPVPLTASAKRGQQLFGTSGDNPGIGCMLCHTPMMITGARHETEALQSLPANLYSDLLIHHMGKELADNVTQGLAQGDMFRTTPLWGIGQRIFFLHDGRTSDLLEAIHAHGSDKDDNGVGKDGAKYQLSEATAVITKFNALSVADKQAMLDFLRSL